MTSILATPDQTLHPEFNSPPFWAALHRLPRVSWDICNFPFVYSVISGFKRSHDGVNHLPGVSTGLNLHWLWTHLYKLKIQALIKFITRWTVKRDFFVCVYETEVTLYSCYLSWQLNIFVESKPKLSVGRCRKSCVNPSTLQGLSSGLGGGHHGLSHWRAVRLAGPSQISKQCF